jgi:hypothetical protein
VDQSQLAELQISDMHERHDNHEIHAIDKCPG